MEVLWLALCRYQGSRQKQAVSNEVWKRVADEKYAPPETETRFTDE